MHALQVVSGRRRCGSRSSSAATAGALVVIPTFQFDAIQPAECRNDLEALGHGHVLTQSMDEHPSQIRLATTYFEDHTGDDGTFLVV